MGSIPGAGGASDTSEHPALDRATIGSPAKYVGYHLAENEEDFAGFNPLHVELGYPPDADAVTVLPVWDHQMLACHAEQSPDQWLRSVSQYLVGAGRLGVLEPSGRPMRDATFGCLVLAPDVVRLFIAEGWSKRDISQALHERCLRSLAWLKDNGWKLRGDREFGASATPEDEQALVSITATPADLLVVACGGPAGSYSAYLHPFGDARAVSRLIGPAGPTEGPGAG